MPDERAARRTRRCVLAVDVLFYSGDDADAKAAVRALMEKAGLFPVDLGALDVGGPLASPPFGPLAGVCSVKIS